MGLPFLHTLLLAAYPVLSLFARNSNELSPMELLAPLAATFSLALILLLIARAAAGDWRRASLLASLFLLIFFSHGHLLGLLRRTGFWRRTGGGQPLLLLILLIVFLAGARLVMKRRRAPEGLIRWLNIASLILVAFPLAAIARGALPGRPAMPPVGAPVPDQTPSAVAKPDIYYIVLDGYAREDVLREVYGFDNGPFIRSLEEKGFRVAARSTANYPLTYLSLASSLNFTYLDEVARRLGPESTDFKPLIGMIQKSAAVEFLKSAGYTFACFDSGYGGTRIKGADLFLSPGWGLTEFQNELLETTPVPWLFSKLFNVSAFDRHRDRILYALDHLQDPARSGRPTFVFAHIMAGHVPFVLGRNGEKVRPEGRFTFDATRMSGRTANKLLRDQLTYVNGRLLEAIGRILAASRTPPVIILQSDHGVGPTLGRKQGRFDTGTRMSIFNAFYLPCGGAQRLPEGITPVNTFRLVFNACLGAGFELLPDRNFLCTYERPYRFTEVTDKLG